MVLDSLTQEGWGETLVSEGPVPAELAAEIVRIYGMVPPWLGYVARVPWVPRAAARLWLAPTPHIPAELQALIALVVSQDNSCRFCYGSQRAMMRIFGFDDAKIERIERDLQEAVVTDRQSAALDIARRLSRSNPVPTPAEFEALRTAGYGPEAIRDVAYKAAAVCFSNRLATLLALPPMVAIEQSARNPVMRFFLGRFFTDMLAKIDPLYGIDIPAGTRVPCDGVILALGDAPAANILRATMLDVCASEALPLSLKMLINAVIAHGLGCEEAEAEARDHLVGQGFAPEETHEIVATLQSPRLDDRSSRILRFVRETIRYEPMEIQRRFRALAVDLGPEEIVELAGVAALANCMARLAALLEF